MVKPNNTNSFQEGADKNPFCAMVLDPMKKFRKNLAFTLAEVLITLGIIGIVAAMVIPSLINAYQKHVTVTRLKQTYAQLTQAVKLSEADNGDVSGWDLKPNSEYDKQTSTKVAQTYFIPYLKYAQACDNSTSECGTYDRKYLKGASLGGVFKKIYGIVLMNGVIVHFWPRNSWTEIILDINGAAGPNILGKDVFKMVIYQKASTGMVVHVNKAGLYMYGEGHPRGNMLSGTYGCNKTGAYSGHYCGALIKEDGWKISKDYPW